MLGGSLGGVVTLAAGCRILWWLLRQMLQLFWAERRTTRSAFAGAVRDSSLVGGFGADSITATGQLRGSTIWGGDPV